MPSSFTSSQQKQNQTQQTSVQGAGPVESALQDQLFNLGSTQMQNLSAEQARQMAFMNPHEALTLLNTPAKSREEIETAMRQQFGNDLVDRFNAGGGTGKGLTEPEFQAIRNAQRQFAGTDLREQGQDLKMQLQQQIAQEQFAQQLQGQALDRLQNPYALSPEEQSSIQGIYDAARNEGKYNINLGLQNMATSRGLNLSDSPVANEAARQLRFLEQNIGAAKSQDLLNRGDLNRNFGLNALGFANNLMQQNFQNRVGVNQMVPTANQALMAPLLQNRMANVMSTSSGVNTNTPSGLNVLTQGLGAAGGLLMGAGLGLGSSGLGLMGGGGIASGGSAAGLGGGSLQAARLGFGIPTFGGYQ